jgi:tRNA(adenine34) deaminase|tara:strand:- start:3074 stop:3499 length:426 start_codon:yes stop_codon:yes gene_type:complete
MKQAFDQAKIAFEAGEIPIGAVVVSNNKIIARTHNQTELLNDFTAHAEMLAFTSASEYFGNKYLDKCTLYVTLEPCVMCTGASFWTRISKVVYGASDPKRGFSSVEKSLFHPKTIVKEGIMEKECSDILDLFFEHKRLLGS